MFDQLTSNTTKRKSKIVNYGLIYNIKDIVQYRTTKDF